MRRAVTHGDGVRHRKLFECLCLEGQRLGRRVLGRPALVPVPSFALELLYGEMARATILAGQRVLPRALLRTGFRFAHPTLEEALRFELAR